MVRSVTPVAQALAAQSRVLLLGGLAVIFHGLSRLTKDVDIWLEPGLSEEDWAQRVNGALKAFPESYLWDLSTRRRILPDELVECISVVGVVRVGGLEDDLDIFRKPHNLTPEDFDRLWSESLALPSEQVRVMDASGLLSTKLGTERDHDFNDIVFLEGKIRAEFAAVLAGCAPEEARKFFARYADHVTCGAALRNPHAEVRELAIVTLRELAEGQNPFAREMLAELGVA